MYGIDHKRMGNGRSPAGRRTHRRHIRETTRDAGQAALITVVALSVLLMTIGAMLVQQTIQTAPELQTDSVQHYAYRALEAGMNAYQSIVNTNPNLANCNTSTNATPQCQGAVYQTWNLVANTDGGGGVVPEWYLFDNPQPQFSATDGSLTTLKVQIVGVAGIPSHYSYQSAVANMVPINGFLNVVWWSDFESSDQTVDGPVYRPLVGNGPCLYNYSNGYNGPGNNCTQVNFLGIDTINGPVFSNDSIYVSGGPSFGTSAHPASVKTHDPNCLFVDGSSPPNCVPNSSVAVYNAATSADNQPLQTPPQSDAKLADVAAIAAPNNGCTYYGPTTVTLTGTTMTVNSPDTKVASASCPLNGSGNLPPNGVLYVNDAVATSVNPNSQLHGAGANPFDDAAHNGRYAQTCGDYTASDGTVMPCYFGFSGSATQDSEGDAFVSGTLAASATVRGELTIGTSNDVIIDGNLNYTDCSTPNEWVGAAHETACNYRTDGKNDSLGLIANNYIEVDHPIDPRSSNHDTLLPTCGSAAANAVNPPLVAPLCQPIDGSQNITIDAAILALKESFGANNWASGPQLGNIIIYGSVQQEARGLITNGNSGFGKYYTWDPRLELASPPSYLDPSTSSYGLDSSAISPRVTCPTLYPVYAGAGTVPSVACPTVPAP